MRQMEILFDISANRLVEIRGHNSEAGYVAVALVIPLAVTGCDRMGVTE